MELESLKSNWKDEMKRTEERLLRLSQERDEVREQLRALLLDKMTTQQIMNNSFSDNFLRHCNSSFSESDYSYSPSPICPFDTCFPTQVSINTSDSYNPRNEQQKFWMDCCVHEEPEEDHVLLSLFSQYAKSLPENGKFLQAVLEAGPLLQTLLIAGPLPRWRNPPPPLQPFHIPQVLPAMSPGVRALDQIGQVSSSSSMANFSARTGFLVKRTPLPLNSYLQSGYEGPTAKRLMSQ